MDDFFDPAAWLAQGRATCELARSGKVTGDYHADIVLAYDVATWPQPWIAADLMTYDIGSARDAELNMVLTAENAVAPEPTGNVDALLAEGDVEGAWRACFAPELADVIEARDAAKPIEKIKEPKKKTELEKVWAQAAETMSPRSAFAGTWPSKWKDAQRRMRVLYARPRSPLFAAAAIEFSKRADLGYSSISAQTFWQALCWFVAAQGDVRQLSALAALERRVCEIEQRTQLFATRALEACIPRKVSEKTRAAIAALAVEKPAPRVELSIASPEERGVAADQLLLAGDPRGEFIVVQQRLVDDGPTKELLKQQKQLLKKHIKAWCPAMVARETCVFRGGVPVAGQLQFYSDVELRSFAGSKALATFETLMIPGAAMGPIDPETIADVVRSLPNLRHVITTDYATSCIAEGPPTALEHLTIEGKLAFEIGRGVPALRRLDAPFAGVIHTSAPWFARLAAIGTDDPKAWAKLRRKGLAQAIVLGDQRYLDRATDERETTWELWAEGELITAKPRAGSTAKSLEQTLERAGVSANEVVIDPTEPARLGYAIRMRT